MKFKMIHECYNVLDLDRSLKFYEEALGLKERRRMEFPDGSAILCFIGSDEGDFELELTWLRDHKEPYDLGEGEFHLAFQPQDFKAAHELHEKMDCICFENTALGVYFIEDPDGYWLEIVPNFGG